MPYFALIGSAELLAVALVESDGNDAGRLMLDVFAWLYGMAAFML